MSSINDLLGNMPHVAAPRPQNVLLLVSSLENVLSKAPETKESNTADASSGPPSPQRGIKLCELYSVLQKDEVGFCQKYSLISKNVICSCGTEMKLCPRGDAIDGVMWRCRNLKVHDVRHSIRKSTFFDNSRMSLTDILLLTYFWIHDYSMKLILHETDHPARIVLEWRDTCREFTESILKCKSQCLGGEGKIVDMFLQEKVMRKRQRDIEEDGQWIFGAVERGSGKCFLITIPEHDVCKLLHLLKDYIFPRTCVITSCWTVFKYLDDEDFDQLIEEHSIAFVDALSGIHVTNFESMCSLLDRMQRCNRGRNNSSSPHLTEFVYKKSLSYSKDPFVAFLEDISIVRPAR